MKRYNILLGVFFIACLLSSCGSVKDIAYLQGDGLLKKTAIADTFDLKIQKDDLLDIVVSCIEPELLRPFVQQYGGGNYSSGNYGGGYDGNYNGNVGYNRGYLVEVDGTINYPLLGKIKVAGMTRREVIDLIEGRPFFEFPYLSFRRSGPSRYL